MITLLYSLMFVISIYMPVIRFSGMPFLLSDLILGVVFLFSLFKLTQHKEIQIPPFLLMTPFLFGFMLILIRSIYGSFELKDLIIPIIHLKMFLFVFSSFTLWTSINKKVVFKVVYYSILVQLCVATLQKLGMQGFATGFFYNIAVNNAMSNVYYGGDVAHIISTHLNVTFRPIGFIGSPTILATYFVIIFHLFDLCSPGVRFKSLVYYSLLLCFSKITLIGFFVSNNIVLPIINYNFKKIFISLMSSFIIIAAFLIFISYNERMNDYFMLFINGDDYGVTHRISVIDFMSGLNITQIFFGVGGSTSFIFDSGFLLTIYRFGIVYLLIVYMTYFMVLKKFSYNKSHVFLLIMFILTDLTIGSFHNQMFFYLIAFSILYSKYMYEMSSIPSKTVREKNVSQIN
ncbi:Uncharacterised protein [Buttiauxella agrestis]|uniref:Lipid A core - O-antigen ligase and related enzymes n=2 Tax=Buttiauxella agrestis TaxID=82977 RepID=A0A381C1I8_9ENTR|nr:Uncharacterised protein [Buttiauxella agrestis]